MNKFIPVHEEIFLNSAITPELPAIVYQDECISFGELDQFSTNLAWQIQDSGIGPGSLVGIYLQPSVNLALSVLAVLRSGAAYIPLSPSFPEERIRYILQDANAGLIITDDSLPHPPTSGQVKILIPDWSTVKNHAVNRIPAAIPMIASDLAYVLYTSGSTGNPKGVMIEHGNLNYYTHWFCQWVMPETGVGLPLTSSFIFAAAVTQFYSTLLSGKTLHILDPLMIRQPGNLLEWYATHPQMGLYCVPTLWSEILNYLETSEGADHKALASFCVYLSGEAVTDDLIKRSFRILPHLQMWNLYGPTEATANLTACRLYPGETAHIGKPLNGTRVFIVGDDMNPVETGTTGELLASGDGIARGYLNLPELTGTTFFTARLNGGDPIRVYRTGDLVKQDESGRLIYVGRKDQQVKIRGFRIELPEIENTLVDIPEVKNAVVKVVEEKNNGKRLVAYLVYKGGIQIPVNELRKMLLRKLPDFMIPEVFVTLEHLPQLPNGKIDRKSLPQPGIQRPELGYPVVFPSTTGEKTMVRIWEEVLGLEGIGMEDNFFDLGGNSLIANEIALEIQALTGAPVPIKNIFDYPTPGSLARQQLFAGANRIKNLAVETGIFPDDLAVHNQRPQPGKPNAVGQSDLSENQKALWFIQQIDPGFSAYNVFYSIRFTGPVDVDCLETALQGILNKHETLRTRFSESGPYTREFAHGKDGNILEIFGAPNAAPEISLTEALAYARKIADLPFNLELAYPFRFVLYKLDKDQYLLAFIVHHIVFDGISFGIFLRELRLFYRQAQTGIKPGLMVPPFSYAAFCSEEKHYLNGSLYEGDRMYWQKQLLHAPVFFEIPTDFIRAETPSREGGQIRRTINPLLKLKLKNLSDLNGASMFMSCLSAFSVLLFRHTGQNDFLIGVPVANRVKKSFLPLIGYFVNTMLFRARIDPGLSFEDWLAQVKDCVLENLSHSSFPLSHMSEVLKTERIRGVNPFFQIMFAYHDTDWDFSTDTGLSGIAEEQFFGRSKFDIFTEIFDRREDAEIVVTFSSELYQHGTIEILLDHYIQILENICVAPQTLLGEIILLSADEFNLTVFEWNRTGFLHNIKGNVADLIIQQIGNTPDLPALVTRHEVFSYREMGEKTDRITANLLGLGVERGVAVGIHLENSPAMVMCIMAVFRAGGIYIPLDPYYPEERLRYVIEKTRIRFLIVDEERKNRKPQLNELIIPVSDLLAEPDISPLPGSGGLRKPEDIAYIMFTSGSTGNPKGVMIRHDSLLNFLVWMKMELNVSGEDTFLSTTSINFDISFLEIFTPLISGARLVLEKRSELQAPEKVEAILNEMQVNTVQFVPSGLKALCDAGVLKRARYLKNIISGGEKLSRTLQEQIFRESDGKLINLYGPTEATVYMACWHCRRNSPLRMVPIGYPIFNATLYILNENLEPVAIGITGEVYLGGQVLAAGYFEDPVQTASRFIPDPFSKKMGDRIYRTGDLARFLADGAVEFLGRTDHQVKVRGFRVELGEVESNILRFPGIRRVVVVAQEQREEDIRLAAFIVPDPETQIQENELRNFLKLHLPVYMIPGSFIIAPSIPALPNGKTDFKTLISLRPQVPKIPDFYLRQMNEPEIQLTAIWKEILDHEAFTSIDNFFEVGGHSLLLVKMKELIAEKLSFEVSIVDLFRYPTIRSLATFISNDKPCQPVDDVSRRVAMRNRNIRNQIGKRFFPDKNEN